MILSAAYALWLYRKVIFGKLEKPALAGHPRPRPRAKSWCSRRSSFLTILFGVYPKPVLDMSAASVDGAARELQQALGAPKKAARLPPRQ